MENSIWSDYVFGGNHNDVHLLINGEKTMYKIRFINKKKQLVYTLEGEIKFEDEKFKLYIDKSINIDGIGDEHVKNVLNAFFGNGFLNVNFVNNKIVIVFTIENQNFILKSN